ncbi:hypothetical protein ACFFGH_33620 [Lysobacter korlensis]|uniref:Abnormal spindle-like microcephaly-associated protein ASH domain-containing protein n=1 Tax=Lysobacter korlensis TaxID=553636 RepID=A0ABV6S3U1_9GAMM
MSRADIPDKKAPREYSRWSVVSWRPGFILSILLLELVALIILFLAYLARGIDRAVLPLAIAGVLPIVVPWGGALGGVTKAIVGLSSYWRNFGPAGPSTQSKRFNAWYLVRLPIGAIYGSVAALIVVLFLETVDPASDANIDTSARGSATLFVVAFVVGYKQDVFAQLISRVTDVLLGPGNTSAEGTGDTTVGLSFDPARVKFGAVAIGGDPGEAEIALVNGSSQELTLAATSLATAPPFEVVGPAPTGQLAPLGGRASVRIRFMPTEAKSYDGELTATIGDETATASLSGRGTV